MGVPYLHQRPVKREGGKWANQHEKPTCTVEVMYHAKYHLYITMTAKLSTAIKIAQQGKALLFVLVRNGRVGSSSLISATEDRRIEFEME